MAADFVTCHNSSRDRHEKGRECDTFPFSICVTCHKPKGGHKPEAAARCPSCGFSRLEPIDDAQPPRLAWTCEIAGQDCRYIARDRDRPEKAKKKRMKA